MRYEAKLDGTTEVGEVYTSFNEVAVFTSVLKETGLTTENYPSFAGRGGYYRYDIIFEKQPIILHIYLKRITFGGRENREYEKRAQFSAALDRTGYDERDKPNNITLMLGIYKREIFDETIICAWDVNDWGYNIGRAFNCFIDVKKIAEALKDGFAQHKTSIGQIACAFKPELFLFYLKNRNVFHERMLSPADLETLLINPENFRQEDDNDPIPKFSQLFQPIIDVLKNNNGIANVYTIEEEVGKLLALTEDALLLVHNINEGYRTELGYRLAWARFYLKKAGFIQSPRRGIWQLTALGEAGTAVDTSAIIKIATEYEFKKSLKKELLSNIGQENGIEIEVEADTSIISHPFDPNKVDIRTRSMSLDLLLKRLRNGAIDLSTDFQRKAGLWSIEKQSRLIESILVKIPLPVFYFDGSNDDAWLVVDGLQRLSTLNNYVNEQSFVLTNLEFLAQFNGKRFFELPHFLQRRIEEFEVTAYVIAPGTPKDLKYNVFKRINTGGLTLTSQEIRNALNQGVPSRFIKRLANLKSFKLATAFSISEDRMLDQEFVTRFLAFKLFGIEKYNSDLENYLNKAMEAISDLSEIQRNKIAEDFDRAMNASLNLFGEYAFRKRFGVNDRRKPINKALFEVWSVLLSDLRTRDIDKLIYLRNELNNSFIALLNNDEDFNWAISSATGEPSRVRKRFDAIYHIIKNILNN